MADDKAKVVWLFNGEWPVQHLLLANGWQAKCGLTSERWQVPYIENYEPKKCQACFSEKGD